MNLKEVAFMSIEELAKQSYVSKAKISKFIKKLGYDNYIAFKDDCLLELEIRKQVTNPQYFLTKKHLHDSLSWIEKNLMKIEQSQIDYFVRKIKEAKHIYLYGVAYSHLLCQYLQYEGDLFQKDILVLDEPTAGLDPKERVRFRDLIKDLGKDSIVLLSTHIVSDIEHIADDILMMKSGQLIYQGKWTDKSGNLEEFYLKQFEEIE